MIPEWVIAGVYLVTGVVIVVTSRRDAAWALPVRLFLASAMFAWAMFYVFVRSSLFQFETFVTLSRWLHIPTASAILLMVVARWYSDRPPNE